MILKKLCIISLFLLFGVQFAFSQEYILITREQFNDLKQNTLNGSLLLQTAIENEQNTKQTLTQLLNDNDYLLMTLLQERISSQEHLEAVRKIKENYYQSWQVSESAVLFWRKTSLGLGAIILGLLTYEASKSIF